MRIRHEASSAVAVRVGIARRSLTRDSAIDTLSPPLPIEEQMGRHADGCETRV
jgi:hypothetical protein